MRLTLRTLLAYMDGELERLYPQEAQEIGKKVEGSKFATDLFHKIRDVMRRLRLAAPSVTEKGTNLDCNTVAEYLDNALPDDRVPDFEEVCLKSDMHLAEVASCHQILAVAQVELFEVEPESRERMYQLPAIAARVDEERQAAVEAASVLSGDGPAPVAPPAAAKVRPRPVVPEYLRDPPRKRRLLPAVAITLLLGALLALVLILLGQTNRGTPIGNLLAWAEEKISGQPHEEANDSGRGSKQAAGEGAKSSKSAAAPSGSGSSVKPTGTAPPSAASGAAPSAAAAPALTSGHAAEQPGPRPGDMPELSVPGTGPPAIVVPSAGPVPAPPKPAAANSATPAAARQPPIVPANPPEPDIRPAPPEHAEIQPAAGPHVLPQPPKPLQSSGGTATPPADRNAIARTTTGPKPAAAASQAKIARFTSDGQDVLLTFDAAGAIWRRALPEEYFTTGQPLLELPCYRSRIDLVYQVGATIDLLGGTRIELVPSGPKTPLGVSIEYGRIVVKPLAQDGARLRVLAGSHAGTLTLASLESVAAFDVTRVHEPGTDPEKVHSHALTKLYVAGGSAAWEETGKQPVQLTAPAEFLLDGPPADVQQVRGTRLRVVDMPKWIAANTINDLDQRAALSVSQALPENRSATMTLLELTEHRNIEVRNLAARCLDYLGQFDPSRSALDNPDYRPYWPDYFRELKEAIARGPETAAAVRESLVKQFGTDAPALYRMLWGYTDKDLEGGEDANLVKDLDHETLIFRVLAYLNLNQITNKGYFYVPSSLPAKRAPAVKRFKDDLRLGKIRWQSATAAPGTVPPARPATRGAPARGPAPPPRAKPDEGDVPDEIKPASGEEPVDNPRGGDASSSAARPKLVFPEPNP